MSDASDGSGGGARRLFCAKPFRDLEIAESGDAYLCCRSWLPVSIGNVRRDDVAAIWNGETAQAIRRSVLDGSFRHCTACPFLSTATGCVRHADALDDPDERALLESGAVAVAARAVHRPEHPEHRLFRASLNDARLRRPFVTLGELAAGA